MNTDCNTFPILQHPDALMDEFSVYEEMIVKELQNKKQLSDECIKEEKEHLQCLNDLRKRENNFVQEEDKLIKEYNRLSSQIVSSKTNLDSKDFYLDTLVTELNNAIKGKEDILLVYSRRNNIHSMQEIADESLDLVRDIELRINELFSQLTKYEYDSDLFYQVVNKIKQDNKKSKQIHIKNQYEQSQHYKRMKAEERFNRIVVQLRKTEAPFQKKKKEVSREIDPEELKRIENEALMNY